MEESSTGLGPKEDNLDRHRRGGSREGVREAALDCGEPASGPTSEKGLSPWQRPLLSLRQK